MSATIEQRVSDVSSSGQVVRVGSAVSATDSMASLEMAGLEDNQSGYKGYDKSEDFDSDDGNREVAYMPRQNA